MTWAEERERDYRQWLLSPEADEYSTQIKWPLSISQISYRWKHKEQKILIIPTYNSDGGLIAKVVKEAK